MESINHKFHSFDALRFFSFLFVFASHITYDVFPTTFFNLFKDRGYIGVYFFFTLSGFLITHILLNEKKHLRKINLKKFFFRRILRIWPLYYLMILFAYLSPLIINLLGFSFSDDGYKPNYFLTCLFLENYQTIHLNKFPNVMPLPVFWSLCVEEHFYIVWGLLLYFTNIKKVPFLIILFLIIPIVVRYYFLQNGLKLLCISTNIDLFMYGAIPAYIYINHRDWLLSFTHKISIHLKGTILFFTIFLVLFSGKMNYENIIYLEPVVLGILFCLSIIIFLPENNYFKFSDKNILSKLGIFTYGLYMIHIVVISLVIKVSSKVKISIQENSLILFFSSLLITIIFSYFSYHFIEKPFLNLKQKFNPQSPSKYILEEK